VIQIFSLVLISLLGDFGTLGSVATPNTSFPTISYLLFAAAESVRAIVYNSLAYASSEICAGDYGAISNSHTLLLVLLIAQEQAKMPKKSYCSPERISMENHNVCLLVLSVQKYGSQTSMAVHGGSNLSLLSEKMNIHFKLLIGLGQSIIVLFDLSELEIAYPS
jgi:hypothetical protein